MPGTRCTKVPQKSSLMFSAMVSLWIFCLAYFNPRLLALLIGPEVIIAKLCLIFFIASINFFWFYVFFHLVMVGFSYAKGQGNPSAIRPQLTHFPKVALLYTTCNDFQVEVLESHLNQDYPNYQIFILDDSSKADYQLKIDGFARRYLQKITVIRRANKAGFKAGNVNHGLRKIGAEYEYFSVSDADTILPPNYISTLLPYLFNPSIAFAQAAQRTNPQQDTSFAQFMGLNTDIHFRHYASCKNQFGFVMWYGHAALMRRDIWERLGGFPEIATEDLAYSMQARQAGYEGVFVEDVVCWEDFPPTYKQYRKRNEKWVAGTAECLLEFYPEFLKAKHIRWFEKLDVLASAVSLLSALPFVLFLLLTGVILPLFFSHFQFQGPMFRMPILYEKGYLSIATQLQSNLFFSWDVFLLMLATVFAPLIPAIVDYFAKPKEMLRYIAAYIFCFFSLQVTSAFHLLFFLFTKKAIFPVTGDSVSWSYANRRWIVTAEAMAGIIFGAIGFIAQNIWFLPVSLALCMSPCLFKWNLKPKIMRYIVYLPFTMTMGIIYLIGRRLPALP